MGCRPFSLLPACHGAEPACPCPQSAESGGGAAPDPGTHRCSTDDWQGARGRAGAGGGLPHHCGTQGMALFTCPSHSLLSDISVGCQGDFGSPPQLSTSLSPWLFSPHSSMARGLARCMCVALAPPPHYTPCSSEGDRRGVSGQGKVAG